LIMMDFMRTYEDPSFREGRHISGDEHTRGEWFALSGNGLRSWYYPEPPGRRPRRGPRRRSGRRGASAIAEKSRREILRLSLSVDPNQTLRVHSGLMPSPCLTYPSVGCRLTD
jgi:hypothetical protein